MQSIQKLKLREGVMPLQESCTTAEKDALWRHQSALPALALSGLWTGQGRRLNPWDGRCKLTIGCTRAPSGISCWVGRIRQWAVGADCMR